MDSELIAFLVGVALGVIVAFIAAGIIAASGEKGGGDLDE